MELYQANKQWAERPDDERFSTLEEMFAACKSYADTARTSTVPYGELRTEVDGDDVVLAGKTGQFARFTHWVFGQLANRIGAPANYLRTLPPTLAVQNLNYGLKNAEEKTNDASLLFHQNGSLLLRCLTSELYARIWNWEIIRKLIPMQEYGWKVPPARAARPGQKGTRPATEKDLLSVNLGELSIKVGDPIAPAGLYASDHDMFAFMINERARINDGSEQGLSRGFCLGNSEVGSDSFWMMTYLHRGICGNHIIWGAKDVHEIRIRHVGNAPDKAWMNLGVQIKKYADESVGDIELKIARARNYQIASTKEDVLEKLFNLRIGSRKLLDEAYLKAEENVDTDGAPTTAWGFAQGMTRLSQQTPFADKRMDIDKAAGKVLEIAF